MAWKRRAFGHGGLEAVSSDIGAKLMREVTTHDDGIYHMGGKLALVIGPLGSGKTTLALQFAQGCCHTKGSASSESPASAIYPETILWRGRFYDYWNMWLPHNLKKIYPGYSRELVVHCHEDDALNFFTHETKNKRYIKFGNGVRLEKYSDPEALYDNLAFEGFNIIYEPSNYHLPPELARRIKIRQFKLNSQASGIKDEDIRPLLEKGLNNKEIATVLGTGLVAINQKVRELDTRVPAPTHVWWFEMMETLIRLKQREEWYSVFMDESHQVFSSDCRGEHWHLMSWFANTAIDLRRKNVSLFALAHDGKMIDYRVLERMHYFVLMPGSFPPYRSRINPYLVATLKKGTGLIERVGVEFGKFDYYAIPNQPPVIEVEGMPAFT